jgi:signal transduction histidine kinase
VSQANAPENTSHQAAEASVFEHGLEIPRNVRALLDAVVAIVSDLDMHSVLDRILVSVCEITGARYAALGVLATDQTEGSQRRLADFITYGLTDEEYRAIGDLPRGHGILGLLIDNPRPLRLHRLQDHPKSYGFPPNHPPMEQFLGVPVRIRGRVFGNLYLTDKVDGADFTEQDQLLVDALARAAGFVIDNARAFAQSERRRLWLEASAEIAEALQPPVRISDALHRIAISSRRVAEASAVAVVRAEGQAQTVAALDGTREPDVSSLIAELDDDIRRAEVDQDVVVVSRGERETIILVPLRTHLAGNGVLLVVLDGPRGPLGSEEADLLASFADQASLALDRAQAISDRQELMLVSDRDRIARDLHDLVIQRLFATGLQLQGARRIAVSDEVAQRIDSAVADLDVTIRDIRSTIFELQHSHELSLRADVAGILKEYIPVLTFAPTLRTSGPLDSVVPQPVAEQLLAVLREALSNVARHAEAGSAVVEVEAAGSVLTLRVTDDGKGLPDGRHESGLRNVRRRAAGLGGTLALTSVQPHGTCLEWRVSL